MATKDILFILSLSYYVVYVHKRPITIADFKTTIPATQNWTRKHNFLFKLIYHCYLLEPKRGKQRSMECNEAKVKLAEDPYRTRITLIQRVKNQRDAASWEDFVRIYRNYIYAIIRNMNISNHDAEDLVQQLMLNMWNKLPKTDVEQIRYFRGWLATITKNFVTDFIRKRIREAERLEKAEKDATLSYLKAIRLPDIDRIAEREWKLHIANLALENIEPLFSGHAIEVFRLSLDGLEVQAIAKKLDLQENSVYRLRNRVKKRLILEIEQLREELD